MKQIIVTIYLSLLSFSVFGQNVKTYIPEQAFGHLPTLNKEINRILPGFETPHYFGGLIEHESCISLKHSRCWNAKSELRTSRERGAGLCLGS